MVNIRRITPKETTREIVDSGVAYPSRGYTPLIKSPKDIRNEMLSATDNTILSDSPSLFNFSMRRMSNPGIIVKKRNPRTCLKIGTSKSITRSVNRRNTNINKKNLLAPEALSDSINLLAPY
jgi:hypothetical protein